MRFVKGCGCFVNYIYLSCVMVVWMLKMVLVKFIFLRRDSMKLSVIG